LGAFLEDPKTTGGSYSFSGGKEGFLRCEVGKYIFEYNILNTRECRVRIKNGSTIKETLKVPYIGNTPNYSELFKMSCGLAQQLNKQ